MRRWLTVIGKYLLVASAVACVTGMAVGLAPSFALTLPNPAARGRALTVVGYAGLLVVLVAAYERLEHPQRPWRLGPLWAWMALSSQQLIVWLGVSGRPFVIATLLCTYLVYGLVVGSLRAGVFVVVGTAATIVMFVFDRYPAGIAVAATSVPFAIAISILLRSFFTEWNRREDLYTRAQLAAKDMTQANRRLQDDVTRSGYVARANERVRLAREVHDTVGHTLTALHAQLAVALEEARVHPQQLTGRLSSLQQLVSGALADVREQVGVLRATASERPNWRTQWLRLCVGFSRSTGMRIEAEIPAEFEETDDLSGEQIYRIIQESITNAFRHGAAHYVHIGMRVIEETDKIVIRISDDGLGVDTVAPGNGLTGMRERVEGMHGDIAWQSEGGKGFDIGITIPGAIGSAAGAVNR